MKPNDDDEVLRLIKKSEFNIVEQILQTPSKISVLLYVLLNSSTETILKSLRGFGATAPPC